HPPLVGGDDEHHRGHRADSGEHVRHEPLVPWHIDERQPLTRGQGQPGEPQVDGQPPAPLGFPPVRFHPGQRADQGGLPVIHVAGGGEDLHRKPAEGGPGAPAPPTPPASASSSPGRTDRRSSRPRPLSARPIPAGPPPRRTGPPPRSGTASDWGRLT